MASVEYLTKRVDGKKKEIAKLESKLSRIDKAKATNWENNPYYYGEDDLRWTLKDLETARAALASYEEQLKTETEKANSRNVTAILEFLKGWKERATEYYREGLTEYFETRKTLRAMYSEMDAAYGKPEYAERKAAYEAAEAAFRGRVEGYYHKETYEWHGRTFSKKVKDRDGEIEYIRPYNRERNIDDAMAKLEKDLSRECDRKYDDIIERTNRVVGRIVDASGLTIGSTRGELNGIIIGERGKAEVESILAGGYNIQCLHIRALIKPIK